MTIAQTGQLASRRPLRLWPGVVAAVLLFLARFVLPKIVPTALMYGLMGGFLGTLAIVVWWAFFSRAPGVERWSAIVLMVAAIVATRPILHVSVATQGMGIMYFLFAIPILSLAFVIWAVATRRLSDGLRRATMVATILLAGGGWALLRTNGVTGEFGSDFAWRWSKTSEERLLAHAGGKPAAIAPTPAPVRTGADWPGFRGPHRDGVVPGVRIETAWSASPPAVLWRRPVGPGWSSMAVAGSLLYTQEQRGASEAVTCYNLATGEPVWTHLDAARFWEANAGAGPRATPTLANGRVYALGATGILNALDAGDGAVAWSRNIASDTGQKVPGWGFAGSPLVAGDMVVVAAAGKLAAYDLATGQPRWQGPDGGDSYSSPQLLSIGGVPQILLLSAHGAASVAPADGKLLWEYRWPSDSRILQPALTQDGDVLMVAMADGGGTGIRRLAVARGPAGFAVQERWTSAALKPYFSDLVVHHGYAFGFDGAILACIDLQDGRRKWKGGRYGTGQLILLPDQDLLLVLSEEGELALVAATPDGFKEIARFPAIKGITWNHPALAGDVLLVRNGQEMAAFRLPPARR